LRNKTQGGITIGRRPVDIEKLVTDLVMSDDRAVKEALHKKILDLAYKKGVYPRVFTNFISPVPRTNIPVAPSRP
jgi:hypothetical protein